MLRYVISLLCLVFYSTVSPGQSKVEKIRQLIKYYADENLFNGAVLVAQNNEVLYKGAVGFANMEHNVPNTTHTKFRIGSITKQFTSLMIMQLVNEGKLDISKPLTTYLPNYRRETGDKITIEHLLTHTSGIPNYTDNPDFYNNTGKRIPVTDFIRLYCSGDLEFDPGSEFNYSNSGYFILGGIIEAVTRQSYEEALRRRILEPLGMKETGYDNSDQVIQNRASGYVRSFDGFKNAEYLHMSLPYAAGSLYSSVEDLYKWNKALDAGRLLPGDKFKSLFRGRLAINNVPSFPGLRDSVAAGWFLKDVEKPGSGSFRLVWHNGGINGFLSELGRVPEDGFFITILDNTEGATGELFQDLISVLYDLPVDRTKPSFVNLLQKKIKAGGIDEAYNYYLALDSIQKSKLEYSGAEWLINKWGYQALRDRNDISGAIKLFSINVMQFPASFNVHDSYGEALARAGRYDEALRSYKKAIDILPSHGRRIQHILNGLTQRPDTIKAVVDGHEMIMYKYGSTGPVVVLEAGGSSDHTCWNFITGELSRFATVITYDRPGYRESVSCQQPRTPQRVAEELHEALQNSGIKGPYILGGWSWGGFFVKAFAAKYPAEVRGLLLVDPAAKESYERMARDYPDLFMKISNERGFENYAAEHEFDAMIPAMQYSLSADSVYKGKVELLIAGNFREWPGPEKVLKQIWIDELVAWAKRNTNVNYQLVDSGHFIQREKPGVVVEAVKRLAGR